MTTNTPKSPMYDDYLKCIDEFNNIKSKTLELRDKWKSLVLQNISKSYLVSNEVVEKAFVNYDKSEGKLVTAKHNLIKAYNEWKYDEARIERLLENLENQIKESDARITQLTKDVKDYM
jgi:hypothetical protein